MQVRLLLAFLAHIVFTYTQSDVLTLTRVPNPATIGQPGLITYATNDTTTPVSIIILQKGSSGDLESIATLTTDAQGGQYIWTPDSTLQEGSDYSLEITQGTQVDLFGPFSIQSGSESSPTLSSSRTAFSTSTESSAISTSSRYASASSTSSSPTSTTSTTSTITKSPAQRTENSDSPASPNDSYTNTGAIAGGVVGGVAAISLVISTALFLLHQKRKKRAQGPQLEMQAESGAEEFGTAYRVGPTTKR